MPRTHLARVARLAALALIVAAGCGAAPSPKPAGPEGVFAVLAAHRVAVAHITSGSSGCDDPTLTANAFELQVGAGGSGERTSVYLFVFKNDSAWEASAGSVDACRQRWAEGRGVEPGTLTTWAISPYRAFAEPLPAALDAAIEAALRDAAVSGSGGG